MVWDTTGRAGCEYSRVAPTHDADPAGGVRDNRIIASFSRWIKGLAMPIYAYRCAACGHAKDVLQKISDPVLNVCPACGADSFRKQLTAAGFQLKGSGWYATDFKGGAANPAPEAKPADAVAAPDSPAAASPAAAPAAGSAPAGGGTPSASAATGCGGSCACH
jgi:putative FmdB family regulatory protein